MNFKPRIRTIASIVVSVGFLSAGQLVDDSSLGACPVNWPAFNRSSPAQNRHESIPKRTTPAAGFSLPRRNRLRHGDSESYRQTLRCFAAGNGVSHVKLQPEFRGLQRALNRPFRDQTPVRDRLSNSRPASGRSRPDSENDFADVSATLAACSPSTQDFEAVPGLRLLHFRAGHSRDDLRQRVCTGAGPGGLSGHWRGDLRELPCRQLAAVDSETQCRTN